MTGRISRRAAGRKRFSAETVAAARKAKVIGLRAGTQPHRFIAVWPIVVENRVFIRSWSIKPNSWFHVLRAEPRGTVNIDGREISVRAVRTRSERLMDAVDRALLEKYKTPGSIKYARDMTRARSRATTTELVPL